MPTAVCNASVESEPRYLWKCPSVCTVQQHAQCKVHVLCVQSHGCSGSMLYRKGRISIWVWLNLWSQNTQKPIFTVDSFLWALHSVTQFHPGTIAHRSRTQAPGPGRQLSRQKHLLLKRGDLSSNPQQPLKMLAVTVCDCHPTIVGQRQKHPECLLVSERLCLEHPAEGDRGCLTSCSAPCMHAAREQTHLHTLTHAGKGPSARIQPASGRKNLNLAQYWITTDI